MTQKFTDNARALLSSSILAADTTLTVEAAKADRFPVGDTTNWFKAVIIDSSGNREVVKVDTRTLGSGVFSGITRAQDGTTALAFTAGSVVILAVTAADIENALAGSFASLTSADTLDVAGKMRQAAVEGRFTPVGGIIMWSGAAAAIPTGWALCDGTLGTPDLRDKFIIGAGSSYAVSAAGGSKDAVAIAHTHGVSITSSGQSADHFHGGSTDSQGDHHHTALTGSNDGGLKSTSDPVATNLASGASTSYGYNDTPGGLPGTPYLSTAGAHTHSVTTGGASASHTHDVVGTTASSGSAGTNLNLPPYYALCLIMALAA